MLFPLIALIYIFILFMVGAVYQFNQLTQSFLQSNGSICISVMIVKLPSMQAIKCPNFSVLNLALCWVSHTYFIGLKDTVLMYFVLHSVLLCSAEDCTKHCSKKQSTTVHTLMNSSDETVIDNNFVRLQFQSTDQLNHTMKLIGLQD